MPDISGLMDRLTRRGFQVRWFDTGAQAADWLDQELDGQTIGFGGSESLRALGLYQRLKTHNRVLWHWMDQQERRAAFSAPVYLTSANALAETGELVNIDAGGNRVAASSYGPERLIFLIGINKLTADLDSAIRRARETAAPKNCLRLNQSTPCTRPPYQCVDCASPDRLCKVMTIHLGRPLCIPRADILLVGESLGF